MKRFLPFTLAALLSMSAHAVSTIKPPPPWQVFVDWFAAVKKPASGRD